MRKHYLVVGILSLTIFASCKKDLNGNQIGSDVLTDQGGGNGASEFAQGNHVPNELLVKFKKGTSQTGRANALARMGGRVQEHILTKAMQGVGDNEGVYLIHSSMNAMEAIAKAKGEEVEYAEPNWIYTHGAASTDPYYTNGSLWGMYGDATSPANQFGSQAGEAWAAGHTGAASNGGTEVYVGIIDEGIQYTHPDLSGRVKNPGEFGKTAGFDDDGNGYVDDVYGWDFDGNNNTVYDGGNKGSLDDHGTHVAGTIGANADGFGVVGVSWGVKIISGKFLGRRGGTSSNAIKAVDYFTDLKTRGVNIIATNNSWGGGGYSQALNDAIIRAAKANILFIAAAGNGGSDGVGDNNDAIANYPSNYKTDVGTSTETAALYDGVIAVASITASGTKSSFSNYGEKTVDLGAPGSGINSTTAFNTYSSYSGTSMATPHVTGGAALRAAHSADRGVNLRKAIIDAAIATPTSSLLTTGSTPTVTGGRLNVSGF